LIVFKELLFLLIFITFLRQSKILLILGRNNKVLSIAFDERTRSRLQLMRAMPFFCLITDDLFSLILLRRLFSAITLSCAEAARENIFR
jgi:hypothetical protein